MNVAMAEADAVYSHVIAAWKLEKGTIRRVLPGCLYKLVFPLALFNLNFNELP